jgi:hypothetical protein
MQKTGESYTAARLQVLRKQQSQPPVDYAALAGMSDAKVQAKTGRTWAEWARVLDGIDAVNMPHREIAKHVASLGTPDWWTQTVTVGYERIRGLRDRGQRRGGGYEASKSRTFPVSVGRLFNAFANARTRRRWLPVDIAVRSATPSKRMRIAWQDGTIVQIGFFPKAAAKSFVAVQHQKLKDREAAQRIKQVWAAHFDRLGEILRSTRAGRESPVR